MSDFENKLPWKDIELVRGGTWVARNDIKLTRNGTIIVAPETMYVFLPETPKRYEHLSKEGLRVL